MSDAARFDRLISDLYEAAADPAAWPSCLTRLATLFKADGAYCAIADPHAGTFPFSALVGYNPTELAAYDTYYSAIDPVVPPFLRPSGRPMSVPMVVELDAYRRSEVYNDYFHRLGVEHRLGFSVAAGTDRLGFMSVLRNRRRRDFDQTDATALARLAPHFRRVLQLRDRLTAAATERSAGRVVLERLPQAVFATDAKGRLRLRNRAADALLADGDVLRLRRGHLAAAAEGASVHLLALIHTAAGPAGTSGTLTLPGRSGRPLAVLAVPGQAEGATEGLTLLFVGDPERPPSLAGDLLARLYDLTPRQAALTVELAAGRSLAEAAEHLRIGQGTARNYLKQVFLKTDTRRQAELVALVLSGPVPFGLSLPLNLSPPKRD
jgi:DNA-binding CsgD family transcriptional regulator